MSMQETQYRSRVQLRSDEAMARRLTRDSVETKLEDLDRALDAGVDFIERARDVFPKDYLYDFARGLHDKVSDGVGRMRRELDHVHADPDEAHIDYSALEALLVELA